MIKKFSLLFTFLLICSSAVAQKNNIIAIVVEAETQEPMQYVNVVLLDTKDSSMVDGMVTDEDGEFDFEDVELGDYRIKISFIGFESVEMFVTAQPGETDLGIVPITKSAILLDEVNVTGERSTLTSTFDKKIYSVGKDVSSESGSVSDVLQNVPSVTVDVNGNVTLRGNSNVTFLINGRPSALLRRNAPLALQQLSASTIDRIEVITNPSAKYDPNGSAGIINIVQRSGAGEGLNGQIIGNIGNEKKYNATLSLNYAIGKLNAYGIYSLRNSSGRNIFFDDRVKKDSLSGNKINSYFENGYTDSDPLAHVFDVGLIYQFDKKNLVEVSGNYFLQNSMHEGFSDINEYDAQDQLISRLRSANSNDELESEGEGGIAYEHIFGDNIEHNLALEVNYARYSEREYLGFNELYTFPEISSNTENILVKKSGNQTEVVSEYALPINDENEFEAGYEGEFIKDDIFYVNGPDVSNFIFNQDVHALFALYARDIGDFSVEVGVRGEQVNINSHLVRPDDIFIENDYFKLYPSVNLGYDLSDNDIFGFSYSKRVNRPEADQLNPYVEFIDPRNGEGGNANLKPEQIHSFELGYQKIGETITFSPTLYYRFKYDAFTSISNRFGDSLVVLTTENLSEERSAGLELILSGKLFHWWDFDLTTNIFYDEIDGTNIGYSENKSTLSTAAQLSSFLKLTESASLQLNLFYNSPTLTPQGEKEHIFFINVGLKQMLYDDRVAITFTMSDLFSTYKEKLKINTTGLNQSTNLYRNEPVFYLGLSWRFGETLNKEEKQLEFEETGLRKL